MLNSRILSLFLFLLCSMQVNLLAQNGCITSVGAIYGSATENERAKSILPTPGNDGLYVVGMKEDSVLIAKLDLMGVILWSRTFDIIPGEIDNVTTAILDNEGMIVTIGIAGDYSDGGNAFAFRYNPNTNQVLWAKEYISSTLRTYAFAVVQKGNGNYVLACNPHPPLPATTNDDEIFEVTKSNGSIVGGQDKVYNLGGSDATGELILYQNFIYATGRYTDGAPNTKMRNTIIKFDPANLSQAWIRLGHIPGTGTARLYGKDLVIDQDNIFSTYHGDPAGTSTTNTKLYLQKTDLNGNLLWLKQYELPGNNDVSHQMITSGGGFIVLGGQNAPPSKIVVFKVDDTGGLVWAKQFQFPSFVASVAVDRGNNQIQEIAGNIYITATAVTTNGTTDILVIRLDQNGVSDMPCVTTSPLNVTITTVTGTTFYSVTPSSSNGNQTVNTESPDIIPSPLPYRPECIEADTLMQVINASICPGDSYEGYTIAGTYLDYFVTADGCDSLRILNLVVYAPSATTEQVSICLGESYNGYSASGVYQETYTNYLGCDSIYTLNLDVVPLVTNPNVAICSGQSYEGYTMSGFYTDTLQGPPGDCDTIRFLMLTVLPPLETDLDVTICEGETYEGYSSSGTYIDEFLTSEGCDSVRTLYLDVEPIDEVDEYVEICLGESYNGYTQAGEYINTYQNIFGCDSIHTLTLEVIALENEISVEICDGEQYAGYTTTGFYVDTIQGPPGECDTIRYLDLLVHPNDDTDIDIVICEGDNYEGYTSSGTYVDLFTNVNGCDSIRTLHLTVTDIITEDLEVTICEGQSYEGYTLAGVYTDQFISSFGCDSIRTLTLSIGSPQLFLDISICEGENYDGYNTNGSYIDTLQGIGGDCDTIRFIDLQVLPYNLLWIDQSICIGSSYLGYSATGVYTDTLISAVGCDTIRTLMLTVQDQLLSNIQKAICHGESFEGYSAQGIYIDTFISTSGCDSIRTLDLQLFYVPKDVSVSICSGGNYEGHAEAGIYIDTLFGVPGSCDTIQQLVLDILPPVLTQIDAAVCSGQSFLGYSMTGMYSDTFQNALGCDSIRMLNLTVSDQIETIDVRNICLGESYQGYSMPGIYIDTFQSSFGCDSIRELQLTASEPTISLLATICQGESYLGYSFTGMYIDTIDGINNACDTIRFLNLTVNPALQTQVSKSICSGQIFEGYDQSGIYSDTFQTASGCDSIRLLDLQVSTVIHSTIQREICEGIYFEGYSISGTYTDTFPTVFGCDSVRELILLVSPSAVEQVNQTICDGETYQGYTETGVYRDTLITSRGCDSIVELHLEKMDPISNTVSASICEQVLSDFEYPGIYTDTFISYRGCDSIQRYVIEDALLYIPNVFSPNQDGINDEFMLFPYPETELSIEYFAIFDRFGDMVYETRQWPVIWKGSDRSGHLFQPAVFAYVLIYHCGDSRNVKHGNITLAK